MATAVTLHDEATRRALLAAVWERASWEVKEELYVEFWAEVEASVERGAGPVDSPWFGEAQDQVILLRATFDAVEAIQTAAVGDTVEVDLSPAALNRGLEACQTRLADSEKPLVPGRKSTSDAVQRLIREFETEAVA